MRNKAKIIDCETQSCVVWWRGAVSGQAAIKVPITQKLKLSTEQLARKRRVVLNATPAPAVQSLRSSEVVVWGGGKRSKRGGQTGPGGRDWVRHEGTSGGAEGVGGEVGSQGFF
jgi:hypothetical protein